MEAFTRIEGIAVPLLEDNIDTDAIAPLDVNRHPDYARILFRRRREAAHATGSPFVLERQAFAGARILVTGSNFGCGSSRESAVWALAAFGIRCVVARSFADAFRLNCLRNGLLPVTLDASDAPAFDRSVEGAAGTKPFFADLKTQRVGAIDGESFAFSIDAHERRALLEGLDDIGLTLQHLAAIEAWERAAAITHPHLQRLERAPA